MYENSGDDQILLEGPDQCWWCKEYFAERKVYPELPESINLSGIKFNTALGMTVYDFSDQNDRFVCHRCMSLFYNLAQKHCAERVALKL
jgi:hypothetical protein